MIFGRLSFFAILDSGGEGPSILAVRAPSEQIPLLLPILTYPKMRPELRRERPQSQAITHHPPPALHGRASATNHWDVQSHDSDSGGRRRSELTQVKQWVRDHLDLRDDATVLVTEDPEAGPEAGTVISVLRDDVHREWIIEKDPRDLTQADVLEALDV